MKKILLGFGAVIIIAVGARAFWAYQQVVTESAKEQNNIVVQKTIADVPVVQDQVSATTPIAIGTNIPAQALSSTYCGSDANCFIKAAQQCSPATALITVKQPLLTDFITLTEQLNINGKKSGDCLFNSLQKNVVVSANPDAVQAMKTEGDTALAQGKITQQEYDSALLKIKDMSDISKSQSFWNTQIGISQSCSIPSSALVSLLKGWILPQQPSQTTSVSFNFDQGAFKYCKTSAPNLK